MIFPHKVRCTDGPLVWLIVTLLFSTGEFRSVDSQDVRMRNRLSVSGNKREAGPSANIALETDPRASNNEADVSGCGGTFTSSSGVITSPNYPSDYPNSVHCIYNIIAPQGHHVVLRFTDLDIQAHTLCRNDFLTISDRYPQKICGDRIPTDPIISLGTELRVEFYSDESYTKRGFRIEYTVQQMNAQGASECDREYSEDHGVITSPNFPYNYPNDVRCVYSITAPQGHRVVLSFTDLDLENSTNCEYDWISISNRTDLLCGNAMPQNEVVYSGSEMTIEFRSDDSGTKTGFRIEYRTEFIQDGGSSGCDQTYTSPNGVITSPNFPEFYPSNASCTYRITAPEGYNIVLVVTDLFLEDDEHCTYDSLSITGYEHLLCGINLPLEPIVSEGNEMTLQFRSDGYLASHGFRVEYVMQRN